MVIAIGGALEFKGRWFARYKEGGKRKQVYGKNAEDVLMKRQELIDKLNKPFRGDMNDKDEIVDSMTDEDDVLLEDNCMTLRKWLTDWLETYIKPNKGTSTYKGYRVFVTKHIIPAMGDVKLSDLTPELIQVFLNTKASRTHERAVESEIYQGSNVASPQCGEHDSRACNRPARRSNGTDGGMSPQSLSNMQFMMKAALEIAVEHKIILYNPMDLLNITKVTRKAKRALSHEEEKKIIELCKASKKTIMCGVVIALRLGLDVGELLALKWTDIDTENNQVCIRRMLKREAGADATANKKTVLLLLETNTVRVIPKQALHDEFIVDMKALKDEYISSIGFIPETVIANSNGLPIDPSYYSRLFKKTLDSIRIPNANFDVLKNTFVVRLFEMGFVSSDIQRIMGYSETSRPLKMLKDIACKKAINEQPASANG